MVQILKRDEGLYSAMSQGCHVDMMLMCFGGSMSLYLVIENFRNGDAVPVYRRFRDRGRLVPAGLAYVSS
jgi:hypothetical protein